MAAPTKTFLDQPENLFDDRNKQVDFLFWIIIFTLYFIDFYDSRKQEYFALWLSMLNVALAMFISYAHYKILVLLLLEKKVLPLPSLGREKIEVTYKGRVRETYHPTLYKKKKYPLGIVFPLYFIFTCILVLLDAAAYDFCGNWIANGVHTHIDAINSTIASANQKQPTNIPLLRSFVLPDFTWISNIPEAVMIIYTFSGIKYALRYHRQFIESNIERKRNELEIEALRWQLKPHFLLASLNSLYHAVDNQEKEKGLKIIKKMSKMTRYVVDEARYYDVNTQKINRVPLSKEVDFLKDFIELKQFEKGHKSEHIELTIANFDTDCHIAPMILICYVENAFKHGLDKDKLKRPIKIDLKVEKETLYFNVFNHKPTASGQFDPQMVAQIRKENQDGRTTNMGLAATKKLLEAAYPNAEHALKAFDDPETNAFVVQLMLKLGK